MVLDPGCAGFPRQHDDCKEDCRPEEWHEDRGVTSQSHQIKEARRQITPLLSLPNKWGDVTDRNPGIPRSPKRDLCI
jgi:hypothetical protein